MPHSSPKLSDFYTPSQSEQPETTRPFSLAETHTLLPGQAENGKPTGTKKVAHGSNYTN